ncbi:MAG: succinylglutamate desuccinylase/aspartoacylase family protein [Deltaproteobacteria bacterium]|nr:succinylglutamate desuccinylase/aspartoacylase family protein [Deltaproteobacteria bacterium]MBW2419750.1 succinylglutamate desuccinylase/aspartoacylase family protein [Deltaproteobacteria bacterium]
MSERIRLIEDLDRGAIPESPRAFLEALEGPSAILVPGRERNRCRAVCTLLHGNEPSGLMALHGWLREDAPPAFDCLILIAAVETALEPPGFAHRFLPTARDLNRCFLPPFEGPEGELAGEILRLVREANPECLIDLHNNTGHNPPYGVGPVAGAAELNLVGLFSERFVHSPLRLGALVEATQDDFPSVTVECGRAGDLAADAAARRGLDRYLAGEEIDPHHVTTPHMSVLTNPLRVCVRPDVEIDFADQPGNETDFTVVGDVDRHNFESLLPGVPIGWVRDETLWPLELLDIDGKDRSRDYFTLRGRRLETRRTIIPIMMTTCAGAAKSDCLFYVVEPGEEIVVEPGEEIVAEPEKEPNHGE